MRWVVALSALVVLAGSAYEDPPAVGRDSTRRSPGFHVTGYLPDYRLRQLKPEVGRDLTELIYFSVEPKPDGELDRRRLTPEIIAKLQAIKDEYKLALLLSVGGWNRSEGFASLAASTKARERFASELKDFCQASRFDGIDLDWEHPKNATEDRDYGRLLSTIKEAFQTDRLTLTIAVAGWQDLSPEAIGAVDRIHLMAYDARGRHSTFEFAKSDVARLMAKGVPASKICLGLPFYGRKVAEKHQESTYSEIARKYQPAPDVDEVDGIYFNGLKTIEQKTRFAIESKLAGVMIWEIGQDAPDDRSLLKVIHRTVSAPTPTQPTAVKPERP